MPSCSRGERGAPRRAMQETHLIPRQMRLPLVNETMYLVSLLLSWPPSIHLSGSKRSGSGKISGFRWTNMVHVLMAVCPRISQLDTHGGIK